MPVKADAAFVFGGWNLDVVRRAADLYSEDYVPLILVSGNRGMATADWDITEAERFNSEIQMSGVPQKNIILEKQATNSEENVVFGMLRLDENMIHPK